MTRRALRLVGLGLGLALVGVAFAWLAYSRSLLPYNVEGRYLDTQSGTVYTDNAVVAYGSVAIASWIVSACSLALSRRERPDGY